MSQITVFHSCSGRSRRIHSTILSRFLEFNRIKKRWRLGTSYWQNCCLVFIVSSIRNANKRWSYLWSSHLRYQMCWWIYGNRQKTNKMQIWVKHTIIWSLYYIYYWAFRGFYLVFIKHFKIIYLLKTNHLILFSDSTLVHRNIFLISSLFHWNCFIICFLIWNNSRIGPFFILLFTRYLYSVWAI